jgi:hypothetical protein
MTRSYIIVRDEPSGLLYFIRVSLSIFWECSYDPKEAKLFPTRAQASKVLMSAGKHRQGWRVVPS